MNLEDRWEGIKAFIKQQQARTISDIANASVKGESVEELRHLGSKLATLKLVSVEVERLSSDQRKQPAPPKHNY